jgi:hypothetical protein
MSVSQSQIDSLIFELQEAKCKFSVNYSIGGLNGIYNDKLEYNIVKLQTIIDQLINYDLVNYQDEYFHNLRAEGRQYCILKSESSLSVSNPEAEDVHSRFLITSQVAGEGAGLDVGFALPSRREYNFVNVLMVGYNTLTLGDGVADKECYFANPTELTPKALNDLEVDDRLYVNANIMQVPVSVLDQFEITIV